MIFNKLLEVLKTNEETVKNTKESLNKQTKDIDKRPRRKAGEGSICKITKNGKPKYKASYQTGINSKGKPKRTSFICDTYDEASNRLEAFKKSMNKNPILLENDCTLGDWLDYYLNGYKTVKHRPSSYEKDEGIFRNYIYVNNKLTKLKLRELTTLHIQKHYNQLIVQGKNPSTINNNNTSLIAALNLAIKQGYIDKNPASGVVLPTSQPKEKYKHLSLKHIDIFLAALKNTKLDILLKFALLTGMRIGEILALTWDDINFDKREIYVNKSLGRVKRETLNKRSSFDYIIVSDTSKPNKKPNKTVLAIGPTKNSKERTVALSALLFDELYMLFNNRKSNIVFPNSKNCYLDIKQPQRRFIKILISNEIPVIPLHGLRHTFASMLFHSGVDVETTADIIGDTIETTYDVYIHIMPQKKLEAIEKLDCFLLK